MTLAASGLDPHAPIACWAAPLPDPESESLPGFGGRSLGTGWSRNKISIADTYAEVDVPMPEEDSMPACSCRAAYSIARTVATPLRSDFASIRRQFAPPPWPTTGPAAPSGGATKSGAKACGACHRTDGSHSVGCRRQPRKR